MCVCVDCGVNKPSIYRLYPSIRIARMICSFDNLTYPSTQCVYFAFSQFFFHFAPSSMTSELHFARFVCIGFVLCYNRHHLITSCGCVSCFVGLIALATSAMYICTVYFYFQFFNLNLLCIEFVSLSNQSSVLSVHNPQRSRIGSMSPAHRTPIVKALVHCMVTTIW